MKNDEKKYSINYSWTQAYQSYSPFYQLEKRSKVDEILNRYDEAEHILANMDSYPDAEELIKNIIKS